MTLAEDKEIKTNSVGEEPNRKIIIELSGKKEPKDPEEIL